MLQKSSGAAEGHSTAPYSTRPGWGARGRPGPRPYAGGDGLLHPSPGFAPPTGATIAGGTPRTCVFRARFQAGATINRGRAEPRGTACSRPTSRAAARCACRRSGRPRKPCARRPGSRRVLPATSRITSPVRKPGRGRAIRIDLRHHHAFAAGARDIAGGSEREAEARHFGAARCRSRSLGVARAWRCSRGSSPSVDVTVFSAPLLMTPSLTLVPGGRPPILLGEIARILHRLAVHRGDHVAGLDAGLDGRTVGLRLGDQRAFGLLQAEAVGDVGVDRLDLHADPSARDRALVLELGHDRLHGVGRDRERDADRAAGGRDRSRC